MVTVRFPSGVAVQYNGANHIHDGSGAWYLKERKGVDYIIAAVPKDCIVEYHPPCRVYNAVEDSAVKEYRAENDRLRRTISALKGQITKLKK